MKRTLAAIVRNFPLAVTALIFGALLYFAVYPAFRVLLVILFASFLRFALLLHYLEHEHTDRFTAEAAHGSLLLEVDGKARACEFRLETIEGMHGTTRKIVNDLDTRCNHGKHHQGAHLVMPPGLRFKACGQCGVLFVEVGK